MSLLSRLQETGAIGNSYSRESIDHFPELSLSECTSALSVYIAETGTEMTTLDNDTTVSLVESAIAGKMDNVIALSESAAATFKENIKKFYARIKEFIKSIINKIKQWFTANTKSNAILVDKYGSMVKGKDLKDFTFNGFPFVSDIAALAKGKPNVTSGVKIDVEVPSSVSVDSAISNGWASSDSKGSDASKYLQAIKDLDKDLSDRKGLKSRIYKEILGMDVPADKMNEMLYKTIRGGKDSKSDMKIGKDINVDAIIKRMSDTSQMDKLVKSYDEFKESVEETEKEMVSKLEKVTETIEKLDTIETPEDREKARNYLNALVDVMKKQQEAISVNTSCASDVRNVLTQGYKDCSAQDKSMFMKMLQYKTPKSKNNSADGIDELDIIENEYSI